MLYTHYSYQYLLIIHTHTHTHKVYQHSLDLKHDVRAWFKKKKNRSMAEYWCLLLTSFSLNVSFPSFPESNHGSKKSSENWPSENSYRINSNHPRDKCILATSQKSYNVRTHMICIFFPEILHEKNTSVIFEKMY